MGGQVYRNRRGPLRELARTRWKERRVPDRFEPPERSLGPVPLDEDHDPFTSSLHALRVDRVGAPFGRKREETVVDQRMTRTGLVPLGRDMGDPL